MDKVVFYITGQIPSGKNNVVVTRTGKRFPAKRFKEWRDSALEQITRQIPEDFQMVEAPVNVTVDYVAKDKRRRDVPGIIDSVWHALEKAAVVKDDVLLGGFHATTIFNHRGVSKNKPGVRVTIEERRLLGANS